MFKIKYRPITQHITIMKTAEQTLEEFDKLALQAYCKQSESEGFIFTEFEGRSSFDEANGYCVGFLNGYKQALIDFKLTGQELNTSGL